MKKIKIQKNEKVIAFDFYSDLLCNNKLYTLCKLFELNDIYMSIYMVDMRKGNLYKSFVDAAFKSRIYCTTKKHLQDVYMKLNVNNLSTISELLSNFDFDELIIWDCYADWDMYIKDETTTPPFFTINSKKSECNAKFFLDYNLAENKKVEIICDITYDNKDFTKKLQDFIG